MSRLNTRVQVLLRQAEALRAAQVVRDDPARDEALREELLARIGRLRANMSAEEIAAGRALLPESVDEIVASMHEDLRTRMAAR